jgi:hypothetical protein
MAMGGLVEVKAGTSAWPKESGTLPDTFEGGETQPERGSQGLVEFSTMSNGSTNEDG